MQLGQANLGYVPSLDMGRYIPAPAQRNSLLHDALSAFLGGAVGTLANRAVGKIPGLEDPQVQLAKDRIDIERGSTASENAMRAAQMQGVLGQNVFNEQATPLRLQGLELGNRTAGAEAGHLESQNAFDALMNPARLRGAQLGNQAAEQQMGFDAVRQPEVVKQLQLGNEAQSVSNSALLERLLAENENLRARTELTGAQTAGQSAENSVFQRGLQQQGEQAVRQQSGLDEAGWKAVRSKIPADFDFSRPGALEELRKLSIEGSAPQASASQAPRRSGLDRTVSAARDLAATGQIALQTPGAMLTQFLAPADVADQSIYGAAPTFGGGAELMRPTPGMDENGRIYDLQAYLTWKAINSAPISTKGF